MRANDWPWVLLTLKERGYLVLKQLRTRLVLGGVLRRRRRPDGNSGDTGDDDRHRQRGELGEECEADRRRAGEQSVTIAVHMALTNAASLKRLVADVSNPKSAPYGRYLTPAQFAERFAPAAADVNQVKALLEHAGMKNVTVGPHGVYVSAVATVAQLRTAFSVSQNLYSFAGRSLRANTQEPTIPASLAGKVVYIEGLDDTSMLRTPMHRSAVEGQRVAPAAAKSPPQTTHHAAAGGCGQPVSLLQSLVWRRDRDRRQSFHGGGCVRRGHSLAELRLHAGADPGRLWSEHSVKYNGSGVTVAIVDAYASPTLLADLQAYSAALQLAGACRTA